MNRTPPNFDGTPCPACHSDYTVETTPPRGEYVSGLPQTPYRAHGTPPRMFWRAHVLCATCGHDWLATISQDPR